MGEVAQHDVCYLRAAAHISSLSIVLVGPHDI